MAADEHILDNRTRRLVDYLHQHLPATRIFRIVSAYFSVYGYEALQDALHQVDDVRFLFGDPASVGELDPGKKESQSFTLTENGLSPNRTLRQKHLAKACAEWIAGADVSIRSIGKTNFLHGKMYLAESENHRASVVGSSNFARSGLGCGVGANLEINLVTPDAATHTELREWFDDLWTDDDMTRDVKQDVLDVLNRLGIRNIGQLLNAAQRQFKQWETRARQGQRDKAKLLESLGADFLRLQDAVSIARSRRQIKTFYADELERIGRFPDHASPDNRYPPTDRDGELSYQALAEQIDRFALSVYRPSGYLVDEARRQQLADEKKTRNFNQADRERFLTAVMRTNFLKRLESSAHSLTLTLSRTIGKIDGLLEQIERYENNAASGNGEVDVQPEADEDDEEFFINRARHPYHLRELDLSRWKQDLRRDRETLRAAHDRIAAGTPARDGKPHEIKQAIRRKAEHPSIDQDGKPNRELLVFTTFKDTAQYLYDNLSGLAQELGLHLAMVSGDETRTTCGPNHFNAILTHFAPRARGRADAETGEIDLLIATDCISEGQNLQDCDTVLNYDIHWNPVRLIQRFGRIDRMGSRSRAVGMLNYWPTRDMDAYLRLKSRVQARMALADMAGERRRGPVHRRRRPVGTGFPRPAIAQDARRNPGPGRPGRHPGDERLHAGLFLRPTVAVSGKEPQ